VGQRALTYHDTKGVRQDKDKKEKVCHGRVAYRVQSRFMATHELSDHFHVQGGRALLQVGNDEWRDLHCIDINIGLKRWTWTKMGVRFNKCDRNPVVPYLVASYHIYFLCKPTLHLQSPTIPFYFTIKNPKPWKAGDIQSVSSGMLSAGKLLSNRVNSPHVSGLTYFLLSSCI
jgi:hypothetical protein